MKRILYALLAAGLILVSCGFVVAEKQPGAVKAPYPPKVDLSDSQGMIRGVAEDTKTASTVNGEGEAIPAAELAPAQPVKGVSMTSHRL